MPEDTLQTVVATAYYDGRLECETVERLLDDEAAHRVRLLKTDLEREPLEIAPPDDVDIYDGENVAVNSESDANDPDNC